jgi:sugar phosphate isomerase/epimerase
VDPKEVAKALKDHGLTCGATHLAWPRFLKELDQVIEEHRLWGCRHAAIGGLPGEYRSAEGLDRFLKELEPVARRLAEAGMDFSYHNHAHEFIRINGETWLSALYRRAPAHVLKAELDTYWIQAGGGEPTAWVRRCAGRLPVLHVKDMRMTAEGPRFAPIGEGNLHWPEILKAAEEADTEFLMVEQDQCYGADPFECLATSYRFLQGMGYP